MNSPLKLTPEQIDQLVTEKRESLEPKYRKEHERIEAEFQEEVEKFRIQCENYRIIIEPVKEKKEPEKPTQKAKAKPKPKAKAPAPKRGWDDDERKELIELYLGGMNVADISKKMGKSYASVMQEVNKLKTRKGNPKS